MEPSEVRRLAQRLIGNGTRDTSPTNSPSNFSEITPFAVPTTFETLRLSLSKTVGIVGFQALLARSLALAKQEVLWLKTVEVNEDGSLQGLMEAAQLQEADSAEEGCVIILTQILKLLVTFVGEDLTLLLIRDSWPEILSPSPAVPESTDAFPDTRKLGSDSPGNTTGSEETSA
jgi:hypothetical protein